LYSYALGNEAIAALQMGLLNSGGCFLHSSRQCHEDRDMRLFNRNHLQ